MTGPEFLDRLRATPRDWRVTTSGSIRIGHPQGAHCPLSYVAGTSPCGIAAASRALALDDHTALSIVSAADDHQYEPSDPEWRRALLDACSLQERQS